MVTNKYIRVLYQSLIVAGLLVSGFVSAQVAEVKPIDKDNILNGIYSQAQATRGERTYKTSCQTCHVAREYKGLIQQSENSHMQISAYFELISQTMPQDAPGSLSNDAYLNLIAYILSLNDFPATDAAAVTEPPSE